MKSDFLSSQKVAALGLKRVGRDVLVSRHVPLLGCDRISIGDQSRVDAFCVIGASDCDITIGRNIHLSAYVSILGRHGVVIGDFATISVRCSIFSSNDDYTGATMTNSTIPDRLRGTIDAPVAIGAHAILGTGVTALPGVRIGQSACVGAGSLVKSDVPGLAMVAGVPARFHTHEAARPSRACRAMGPQRPGQYATPITRPRHRT